MAGSHYAAIVLAAGYSSRMGDFKPLLKIGGETITDRVISLFHDLDIDVLLVTGWKQDELLAGIKHYDSTIAENPNFESGMLSSVQAGISQLLPGCKAFFLMPVDIPLVRTATVNRLLAFADENPGHIIYPTFNSRRGHPPVIPTELSDEIVGWQENSGLNAILAGHYDLQLEFPVADGTILRDADNRDDFTGLLERFENYYFPSNEECLAVLDIAGTPENVRQHCRKVAEVADAIAGKLAEAGAAIDIPAVHAAAILHDIAKGTPLHGEAGAKILLEHGFSRIGEIISIHQDLIDAIDSVDIETKVVYLADKLVTEQTVVSVEDRFREAEIRYGNIPEAVERIRNGKDRALRVKAEIEKMMGIPVDKL